MDSLEEKVFMFMDEQYYDDQSSYSNESELHVEEDLWWQDNSYSDDSPERALYWESQVALLQVQYNINSSFFNICSRNCVWFSCCLIRAKYPSGQIDFNTCLI